MATPSKELAQVAVRGLSAPHERLLGWLATLRPGEGRCVAAVFRVRVLAARLLLRAENVTRAVAVGGRLGSPEELRHRRRGSRAARLRPAVWLRVPARDQESHGLRDHAFLRRESRRFLCGQPSGRRHRLHLLRLGWRLRGHHRRAILGSRSRRVFRRQRPAFVSDHHGRCDAGRARGTVGCARLVRRRQPCVVAARSGGAARRDAAARRCGARFGAAGVARCIGGRRCAASRIRWAVSH